MKNETKRNIKISHLCSFVHITFFVLEVVVVTLMSGVVQLAFVKSLVVWEDFEIYTDTIGFVVTLQLTQIEVDDIYSCDGMFRQTSVTKHKLGRERKLTTFTLKDKRILDFFSFFVRCNR